MSNAQIIDEKYLRMTSEPLPRLIIQLGLPTIATTLISSIYSMADTYFVGTLGKSASGAIGVVFCLLAILQAFGFLFGQGSGSILSRMLGQQNTQSASRFGSTGFFLALGIGALIGILGLCFLSPLLFLLGSTDTILPYAREYSIYILLGAPFFSASCVLNNILRYEGMSLFAMIGLVAGGLLNMVLDPLFILVFGMGTGGAGLATALSQGVSFFILLYMFLSGKTATRLRLSSFTRNWREIVQIVATGLPALLRQGLGSLSGMALNHQAGLYGDAAIAAMSIVSRISHFIFSVNLGIGQGFQPVASFNYGAKKYSRVRDGFWFTSIFSMALLSVVSTACLIFAEPLLRLFQKDASVVAAGVPAFQLQCISHLFLPLTSFGNMMFQSVGKTGRASFLAALRSGLCFIPLIMFLPSLFGLNGVILAQPISDVVSFLVALPISLHFIRCLPRDGTP